MKNTVEELDFGKSKMEFSKRQWIFSNAPLPFVLAPLLLPFPRGTTPPLAPPYPQGLLALSWGNQVDVRALTAPADNC